VPTLAAETAEPTCLDLGTLDHSSCRHRPLEAKNGFARRNPAAAEARLIRRLLDHQKDDIQGGAIGRENPASIN